MDGSGVVDMDGIQGYMVYFMKWEGGKLRNGEVLLPLLIVRTIQYFLLPHPALNKY